MHIATRLSDEVSLDAVRRDTMQLEIVRGDSGFEDRNRLWSQFLREYEVTYPIATRGAASTALEEVYNAFLATGGGEHSFDFEDWRDNSATDEVFGVGDGVTTVFSLFKSYTFGSATYSRRIYRPVTGITLEANGGAAGTNTIDYDLGTVTFNSAPANGVELTWSGSFYVPVRFDSQIQSTAPTTTLEKFDTFTLYEVRLRAEDFA